MSKVHVLLFEQYSSVLTDDSSSTIHYNTMAPKRTTASSQPTSQSTSSPPSSSLTSAFTPTKSSSSSSSKSPSNAQDVLFGLWNNYLKETPQRVKLVDCFMAFLVVVGGLQFVYAVLGGSYVSLSFPLTQLRGAASSMEFEERN